MNIYLIAGQFRLANSRREAQAKYGVDKVTFIAGWQWGRKTITQQKQTLTLGRLQVKFFDLPKINLNVNLYRVGNRLAFGHGMRGMRQRFGTRDIKFLIDLQWNRSAYPDNHGDKAKVFGPLQIGM